MATLPGSKKVAEHFLHSPQARQKKHLLQFRLIALVNANDNCCSEDIEHRNIPTRARMTVSNGAAGNATLRFISSICSKSTVHTDTQHRP